MKEFFVLVYISIKEYLSRLKKLVDKEKKKKKKLLMQNTDEYRKEIIDQLIDGGWKKIRKYSLSTWKYYGVDHIRLTFMAEKSGQKYIIKVTKGFEDKINNSIKFQNMFNNFLRH